MEIEFLKKLIIAFIIGKEMHSELDFYFLYFRKKIIFTFINNSSKYVSINKNKNKIKVHIWVQFLMVQVSVHRPGLLEQHSAEHPVADVGNKGAREHVHTR